MNDWTLVIALLAMKNDDFSCPRARDLFAISNNGPDNVEIQPRSFHWRKYPAAWGLVLTYESGFTERIDEEGQAAKEKEEMEVNMEMAICASTTRLRR